MIGSVNAASDTNNVSSSDLTDEVITHTDTNQNDKISSNNDLRISEKESKIDDKKSSTDNAVKSENGNKLANISDDLQQKLDDEKAKVKDLEDRIVKRLLREAELNYQVQTLQKQLNAANKELKQYKLESKPSLKLTTKTIKKSKKNTLQAKLKFSGKIIKGKKVTFVFNGKVYTAKTNKKGIAKVNLKKSSLKNLKAGKKVYYYAIYGEKNVKKAITIKK